MTRAILATAAHILLPLYVFMLQMSAAYAVLGREAPSLLAPLRLLASLICAITPAGPLVGAYAALTFWEWSWWQVGLFLVLPLTVLIVMKSKRVRGLLKDRIVTPSAKRIAARRSRPHRPRQSPPSPRTRVHVTRPRLPLYRALRWLAAPCALAGAVAAFASLTPEFRAADAIDPVQAVALFTLVATLWAFAGLPALLLVAALGGYLVGAMPAALATATGIAAASMAHRALAWLGAAPSPALDPWLERDLGALREFPAPVIATTRLARAHGFWVTAPSRATAFRKLDRAAHAVPAIHYLSASFLAALVPATAAAMVGHAARMPLLAANGLHVDWITASVVTAVAVAMQTMAAQARYAAPGTR